MIGRWGFRRGLELDRATHEDLLADPEARPAGTSSGEVWLLAVSVVLALLGVAAVGYLVPTTPQEFVGA
ncbi:hypothetical protein PSH03_003899 [Micromonospora sp. PSH03]|uniref:hypothetical protein n=1 Tax=Micromonospora TaxID=1873 RepID=UPI001B39B6C0|nr:MULTISPECIES: hypothetical protein [Micromonospora]MBQ0988717.1 hypothetical protein [Micromonospora sp. H61]MCG5454735.1 hypothetical protein [Micromonospora salmantinae]